MIFTLTIVTAFFATITDFAVGRQMCYNCQYTITSTKQGIECASEFKNTNTSGRCPDKCIIHSETNLETKEVRSYFRGCGPGYPKNTCEKFGNVEVCSYTCTENFCNDIDIRPIEKDSSGVAPIIDQTVLHLNLFAFCLSLKVQNT